ncbi:MAG: SGNH/GDSL hydrolase family protein [Bacteroidaceae bacterium]|nr:SGNH/GDSL hydrolase family protein [Bacteroidaceae bacterium]
MKQYRLILFTFYLLLAIGLSAQHPVHVVLLGDSNTWIGGEDCDQPRGWSKWFKEEFQPISCHSYARSGATWTNTEQTEYNIEENIEVLGDNNVIYNQIQRLNKAVSSGVQEKPDLIVMMAGTNDMWFSNKRPGAFSQTVEQAFSDTTSTPWPVNHVLSLAGSIRYGCDILNVLFPQAQLVLMTPLESTKVSDEVTERTGNMIERCGERMGIHVIRLDKSGCVSRSQELKKYTHTSDGVHTNEVGARRIGHFVAEQINKWF